MDYPAQTLHKPTISSWSSESPAVSAGSMAGVGTSSTNNTWPVANLAIFIPFTLKSSFWITKVGWGNGGTASGNVDMGVYTPSATRLFSTGSTAMAGSSVQTVTLGTAVLLVAGLYYMALAVDNTTAKLFSMSPAARFSQAAGIVQMASAFPLPATATFAAMAQTFIPLMCISHAVVL